MFENWEEQVRNTCRITENDHILLAVSGGVDSMVMLELFARSSFKFGIAHCNFKLRGEDSFADEQLVRETAGQLGVRFHLKRFNTMAYAGKRGISMEMAARELRYAWFRKISETDGYTKIATAHHREDAEETFLLNLGRGSGIKGLQGIPPISGNIIRPMRYFSKQNLLAFASEQGIPYREDSTNNEDICQRNVVRHHILPALRQLNPNFDSNMDKSMRILHAQGAIYFNHIKEVATRLLQPEECGFSISMESVAELPFSETYLFEILHPYGFNAEQIASLLRAGPGSKGKRWISQSHCLWKHGERLILQPLEEEQANSYLIKQTPEGLKNPCPFLHFQIRTCNGIFSTDPRVATLDMNQIVFPLQVRYWQPGDRFVPLGMKGNKKLSDFFTNNKMNGAQKELTPLLCNGNGDILWIIGHRIDNRYRITRATSQMLVVNYFKP
ncbi:MAG: tRNA lysidine(34) synthetase TilS [Bacteroidales bacterium]|jgi:tRNA(Ile)-lysidine synthase|nr:tRNA lysidine(34) synthetase TilS [Bacteroidales bacterium]